MRPATLLSTLRAALMTAMICQVACGPTGGDSSGGDGGTNDGDDGGCSGAECANTCPNGTATSLTGQVLAPNGIDPIPEALVYVPRSLSPFPDGVDCELCSETADSARVATVTNMDGTFSLSPIPTPKDQTEPFEVQVVAQKGRFRKVNQVLLQTPCGDNSIDPQDFALPSKNQGDDTVPAIAAVTGNYDVMECVLLSLGLERSAFDLYNGINAPIFGGTPNTEGDLPVLLEDLELMKKYNIIFINCGTDFEGLISQAAVKQNIEEYVRSGGRLYITDLSYDFVEQIDDFASVIDFEPGASGNTPEQRNAAEIGAAGITTEALVHDDGMASWLEAVEDVTGDDIISDDGRVHVEHFATGWAMQHEVAETDTSSVWLSGQVRGGAVNGVRPLTTTFDHAECGRVLYSSYHTLGREAFLPSDPFPGYCSNSELSPQERVLLYLILHVADCIGDVEIE